MSRPFISVIIIAYNRTEFLSQSIGSVKAQTLSLDNYEIIVTSNFELDKKDNMFDGVIHVAAEGGAGWCLAQAIDKSRGAVIAILDDDDIWHPTKLQRVFDAFKSDRELGYYHNNIQTVDKELKPAQSAIHASNVRKMSQIGTFSAGTMGLTYSKIRKMVSMSMDFNNSSISFRKSILKGREDVLERAVVSLDAVLFYLALSTDCTMRGDGIPLTSYRVHGGNSSAGLGSDGNSYFANRRAFIDLALSEHRKLLNDGRVIVSDAIRRSISCMMADSILELEWFKDRPDRRQAMVEMLRYSRYFSVSELLYNTTLILFNLMYLLHPSAAKQLYLGRYRGYMG